MAEQVNGAASLTFPETSLVGSVGLMADLLSRGTEVPREFYFAAGLTVLGHAVAGSLQLDIGFEVEPRLYTVLLGDSYAVKKSTALKRTLEFFEGIDFASLGLQPMNILYGVGSAEGLAIALRRNPRLLLAYDELRVFVDKSNVQNSALLPMVAALFDGHNWDNPTARRARSVSVRGARLALLGCCTTQTYADMWSNDAIAIGFPNRLFLVGGTKTRSVAWPAAPNPEEVAHLQALMSAQLLHLPAALGIDSDAKEVWEAWYQGLQPTEHAKRLDTIGLRLLGLLAFTQDKTSVDLEVVVAVIDILDYELRLRELTDPIDADNRVARLEQAIRKVLGCNQGPTLRKRDLRRRTHADRYGLWAFDRALENLVRAGDIVTHEGSYRAGGHGE
jgi:hypothetical protein